MAAPRPVAFDGRITLDPLGQTTKDSRKLEQEVSRLCSRPVTQRLGSEKC